MICVYAPNETDFSMNGLGAVMPSSCAVTETLNGEWELEMTHPIDEFGKYWPIGLILLGVYMLYNRLNPPEHHPHNDAEVRR